MVLVDLPIIVRRDDGWFVAACPLLDVVSQGPTARTARINCEDAVRFVVGTPALHVSPLATPYVQEGGGTMKKRMTKQQKDFVEKFGGKKTAKKKTKK